MAVINLDAEINFISNTKQFELAKRRMKAELDGIAKAAEDVGDAFSKSLKTAIVDGKTLEQTLKDIALQISNLALDQALKPFQDAAAARASTIAGQVLGGLVGLESGASAGAGTQSGPSPDNRFPSNARISENAKLARGGIFNGPVVFTGGGGLGMMAEAGPEAVLPLRRGSDGRLGVQTAGGAPATSPSVNVTFNISTPDVDGFRKSQAQIASMLTRTVNRGRRNL